MAAEQSNWHSFHLCFAADPLQQWPGMEKLTSVQDLLDQNKMLIAEINQVRLGSLHAL